MDTSSLDQIKPIFGFGYMRSGTTLLHNILKLHPDIYTAAAEPKIIDSLTRVRKAYPDLNSENTLQSYVSYLANVARFGGSLKHLKQPLIENDEFSRDDLKIIIPFILQKEYIPIIKLLYNFLAYKSGKKYWYVKGQTVCFNEIFHAMPDALFLEIVRDPRDILASKKMDKESVWNSKRYSKEQKHLKSLVWSYNPLWDSLSWRSEIVSGTKIKENNPDIIFSIRYEDLVSEPQTTVKNLCSFLNIQYSDDLLQVPKRNSSNWSNKPAGIGSQSVNKYKTNLPAEDIKIIQSITKTQLDHFNNIIDKEIKYSEFKIFVLYCKSAGEFFQRLYKRLKLGCIDLFLNVVLIYWKKLKQMVSK